MENLEIGPKEYIFECPANIIANGHSKSTNQSRNESVKDWQNLPRKRRMVSFGCKMLLTDAPARGKVNNLGANLCVKGKLDFESGIKSTQL